MKNLVLITSNFPFGTGESFISQELNLLSHAFERVIIVAQNISGEEARSTPENVKIYRHNTSTSLTGYLYLPLLFILNSGAITEILKGEIEFRLGISDSLTIRKFLFLFKKVIKAIQLKEFIDIKLKQEGINDSIVFYSYWLKTGAHAAAMLNYRKSIKVARGHGSDIYEEKTGKGYLPLLKFSALNLDAIFFISNQGKYYFEKKVRIHSPRFTVSYLGVDKPESLPSQPAKSDKYVIVSCSNMIALKRIDRIIESLEMVTVHKKIQWLHFGDGILKNELDAYAKKRLGNNKDIIYRFMGHFPNTELLRYYSENQVDLFLNTSSTEGVPVSIMEAQSFSIPVIATDTGGVKELVREGTGSLLPVDFKPLDLAKLIDYYSGLSETEIDKIRMNTFLNWKANFNASTNYAGFITQLNSIFASTTKETTAII